MEAVVVWEVNEMVYQYVAISDLDSQIQKTKPENLQPACFMSSRREL